MEKMVYIKIPAERMLLLGKLLPASISTYKQAARCENQGRER
jgi:hypothetical protein